MDNDGPGYRISAPLQSVYLTTTTAPHTTHTQLIYTTAQSAADTENIQQSLNTTFDTHLGGGRQGTEETVNNLIKYIGKRTYEFWYQSVEEGNGDPMYHLPNI